VLKPLKWMFLTLSGMISEPEKLFIIRETPLTANYGEELQFLLPLVNFYTYSRLLNAEIAEPLGML